MPGVSLGAVMNLIGGVQQIGNQAKAFVAGSIVTVQNKVSGIASFVSNITSAIKNPMGVVTGAISSAIGPAISAVTALPALQGISGLIPEAQSLVSSVSGGFTEKLGMLTSLTDKLSGISLPNVSIGEFGLHEAMGSLDSLHKTFGDTIPPALGIDTTQLTAPLDMAPQLAAMQDYVANIDTHITNDITMNLVTPAQAAINAQTMIDSFTATMDMAVTNSQNTFNAISDTVSKATTGGMLATAASAGTNAAKEYADKVLTTAGKGFLGIS